LDQTIDTAQQSAPNPETFGADAFVSEAYARAEPDKLWRKVWQHACRLEEIPEIGDYVVYDIGDDTILVVRSGPDEISAFHNVCAHRGKRLAKGCGHAREFRCSYHAWRYNLQGENVFVLDRADWGEALNPDRLNLPPVRVETWGGWVWINMDPDGEPLRQYLEPLADLLDAFEFDKMRYRWRMWGVFDCNWKVAIEAFLEAYHVEGTHPQLINYADFYTWSQADGLHSHKGFRERKPELNTLESNTYFRPGKGDDVRVSIGRMQEQIWRTVNASTTQTLVDAAARLVDELPQGASAGEVTAHWLAAARRDDAARGVIWPSISPEHLAKCGNSCHFFPNLAIGYGFTFALCYRARPYGLDPNKCVFEAYVIERFPAGQEPQTQWIQADPKTDPDKWPPVLLQDFDNMTEVQRGMRSAGFRGALPNPLQEVTVSNFHRNLGRYMGIGAPRPLA
jgi:phenylpropionate dioxygenase-like ring-hydroxylating dioxygenase large terminal subunit